MTMYTYNCPECGEAAYDVHVHRMVGCHKRTVSIADVKVGDVTWSRSGPHATVTKTASWMAADGRVRYSATTAYGTVEGLVAAVLSLWVDEYEERLALMRADHVTTEDEVA